VLRDGGNEVAAAYGLRWKLPDDLRELYLGFGLSLPEGNGDESWTLPLPARYIIDRGGVVRYARSDPDYTRRPEPEETLAALETIAD
jgi:peroxiredoxin